MDRRNLYPDTTILSGGFGNGIKSIFTRGEKLFELSNHLGNVLTTVSDRRIQHSNDTSVAYYTADIMSANDYYPFGMLMPGRKYAANNSYRFGFNGQEMSNEIKGLGNSYTALFWEYDSRIGRRWNLDPKPTVGISQYSAFNNNPILYNDPLGDTTSPRSTFGQKGFVDLAKYKAGALPYEGNILNKANAVVNNWILGPIGNLAVDAVDGISNPGWTLTNMKDGIVSLGKWFNDHPDIVGGANEVFHEAISFGKENWKNPDFHLQVATSAWGVFGGSLVGTQINLSKGFTLASSSEEMVTLYRGVNSESPAYSLSVKGIVKPRGGFFGHTNTMLHNTGLNGTVKSAFTSWTTDIDVALNFAFRQNGEGVLLTLRVPKSKTIASPNLKQVNLIHKVGTIVSESEVFLKGTQRTINARKVSLSNLRN